VRLLVGLAFATLWTRPLSAQSPAQAGTAVPTPSAAAAGLVAKPKWGQGPEQQRQFEAKCYGRAKNQTGLDPITADSAERVRQAGADSGEVVGAVARRRMTRDSALRAEELSDFRKVMRACLEDGGYTVE